MLNWNPAQYLKFGGERTQVVRDLVHRLSERLDAGRVRRIVDLGSGPGNSTAVLAEAWPQAAVTGLDASPTMLEAARAAYPRLRFIAGDIPTWAASETVQYDLVFSNSTLQWVPGHTELLPRLLARVAPGGALGFQIPGNGAAAACRLPRELAALPAWRDYFGPGKVTERWTGQMADFYDLLAPHAATVEVWETEYFMVVAGVEAIVEWYMGSGLPQYLAALPDDAARAAFRQQYLEGLRAAYPVRRDGKVLFPFKRQFVIALPRGA